jgi:hypothetical protein
MAWQDWINAIKETNEIHKREGFFGKGRRDYKWYPSNYNRKTGEPRIPENHKNLFVKLRFNGHYHSNEDIKILKRFEERYNSDKNLREKINRYLELTELNYRPVTRKTWSNPFGTFKMLGPTYKGKKYGFIPSFEKTELGIEYDKLEFELKQEFNKI